MRVRLMTFRYSATLGGFDTTPLDDFLRDKEVLSFREHFFTVNAVPHLTCVVHVQEAVVPAAALEVAREIPPRPLPSTGSERPTRRRKGGGPDPCEGMDESERALFNHLREWRSQTAKDEGVPPYVVFTNKQLVAVVRKRPDSATGLGHIDGIGPGKLERYGEAVLACLHGSNAAPPAASEPSEPERTEAEGATAKEQQVDSTEEVPT